MWNLTEHDELYDPASIERQRRHVFAVIGILSFFSVVGTAGNALVLYVFYQKKDKQVSTLFIIVLAFVDFTTCLIVIPYTIVLEYFHFYINSDVLCKLYQFLITSNIPFSALIMVAIAIDRYLCICHPFVQALNLQRAKILTSLLCLFSAALGIIVALMYGVSDYLEAVHEQYFISGYTDPSQQYVSEHFAGVLDNQSYYHYTNSYASQFSSNHTTSNNYNQTYDNDAANNNGKIIVFVGQCHANELIISREFLWYYQRFYTVLYPVCLLIVIILYSLIYRSVLARRTRRARQRSKALPLVQLQNNEATLPSTVEETLLTQVNGECKCKDEMNGKQTNEVKKQTDKKGNKVESLKRKSTRKDNNRMANLKTAAMLFVVTVVFVITFMPGFLMALELIDYNVVVFYMYFANNVANPVVYSFMNKNFRGDLRNIFCKNQGRQCISV